MKLFRFVLVLVLLLVGLVALSGCYQPDPPRRRQPRPIIVPVRPIVPVLPPLPRRKPCPGPWCPRAAWDVLSGATVGGRISPDGVPIQCDYPESRMEKNLSGTDGAGLCVFDSASRAMDWQGIRGGHDFLHWMTRKPGGGYPKKFDAMMTEYFESRQEPIPGYVQMDGTDTSFVVKALSQGKLVCCTYNFSPSGRYSGQRISHMVNVHHHDGERVCIGDNNFVGSDAYEWLTAAEWERCCKDQWGRLWAIAFDAPPPPPVPHN